MKNLIKRSLSMLLALCMVFSLGAVPAFAAEEELDASQMTQTAQPGQVLPYTTEDGHYIARPELLEQFAFPEDWSRAALEFCVANGVLNGRSNGLAERENTTRAEVAAILVRLLGADSAGASLDGYADVSFSAWYCDELSAALGIGLLKGTSATTLEPDSPITREQVCVLLSRTFGIYSGDKDFCDSFADGDQISDYARSAISALAAGGYLNGYYDGTVRPKQYITRAELAKLLYELVTHICDSVDELPSDGNVVYRGSERFPDGYWLYGNLTIGCGIGTQVLEGVDVSQCLTIHAAPGAEIGLSDYWAESLCAAGSGLVYSDESQSTLYVGGNGAVFISADEVQVYGNSTLQGNYGTAYIYEACTIYGDCGEVHVYDACTLNGGCGEAWVHANFAVQGDSGTLNCDTDDVCVTVNGRAEHCVLDAERITLWGSGWADAIDLYTESCSVSLGSGNVVDHVYQEDYNSALSAVHTVYDWNQFTVDEPYSRGTMEGFVDQQGYSSQTGWLIWVSTRNLTVNIFTGSQGNWTLLKTCPCALGASGSPTVTGVFRTFDRCPEWNFVYYKCRYVTYFYGGYAFHSRKWSNNYSYLVDPSISTLVSAGCVRMLDEDCYYIYTEVPLNTTVVVY